MKWQSSKISGRNLYQEYQRKYGVDSDYQEAQKIMYGYPEIHSGLATALHWMRLKPEARVLDIGINNGHELNLLRSHYGDEFFKTLNITGFDLAEDALIQASKNFNSYKNIKFVKGDIREFRGTNVVSNEHIVLEKKSVDAVFAFTSLQSTCLASVLKPFMRNLHKILKDDSQLFIVVPNCHIDSDKKVVSGLYDAQKETVNHDAAYAFCAKIIFILHAYGFDFQKTGDHYIFLHFRRPYKKETRKEGGIFFSLVETIIDLRK